MPSAFMRSFFSPFLGLFYDEERSREQVEKGSLERADSGDHSRSWRKDFQISTRTLKHPSYRVIAFTATQIPFIADRLSPELAGPLP
jgi:hypothetical protein